MANIQIKDANGDIKYLKTSGAGSDVDPYIPEQNIYVKDHTHTIKSIPFKVNTDVTSLSVDTVVDEYVMTVTDPTGFDIGDVVSIMCIGSDLCYVASIIGVSGSDIEMDTPFDFAYSTSNSTVTVGTINLGINGSVSPVTYSVRPNDPGIGTTFHVTKLSLAMVTSSPPILSDFGDIAAGLTKGIVIRKVDGTYQNLFNIKTNAQFAAYGTEFDILSGVGVDGITAKNVFAGPENFGAVISLSPGEDLEIIIQDDLSSLVSFNLIAQGHIVSV